MIVIVTAAIIAEPTMRDKEVATPPPPAGYNEVMLEETTPTATVTPASRARRRVKILQITLLLLAALGLNLLVLAIPAAWIEGLRSYGLLGYLAAFAITALANASVVVPVPYPTVIAQLARVMGDALGIAIVGAAGSTLGETTAFAVGRAGRTVVEDSAFGRWLRRQLRTTFRSWIVLFAVSAPPNPFFDVAGLTAGSLGIPYWVFFSATFAGRIIKLLIFAELGRGLL